MPIEGIWTGEVYGPFGWDNRGVFIVDGGRIVGGDNRQYSSGTYRQSGNEVKARMTVHYYGPPRAIFGEAKEEITIELEGTVSNHEINGFIRRPDKPQFDLEIRLTKRMELPEASAAG